MAEIVIVPALTDNYVYLIHDADSQITIAIDPAEAAPVLDECHRRDWKLTHIINTHHHWDHTGGNVALKKATHCEIAGYSGDKARIPGITQLLEDGHDYQIGSLTYHVTHIPGHTLGHILVYFPGERAAFCGDTLFSLGCGRMFEGTAEQMYTSLQKIASLPEDTSLYCGHEYTLANGEFAQMHDPDNQELKAYLDEAKRLRDNNVPTLPSTVARERKLNPFLHLATSVESFAALRKQKDNF